MWCVCAAFFLHFLCNFLVGLFNYVGLDPGGVFLLLKWKQYDRRVWRIRLILINGGMRETYALSAVIVFSYLKCKTDTGQPAPKQRSTPP